MRISYTYRGEKRVIMSGRINVSDCNGGSLLLTERALSDGNQKIHTIEVEADELLKLAKNCLCRLSEISGVEYRAAVSLDGGNYRIMERTK